jgi:predicted helicase
LYRPFDTRYILYSKKVVTRPRLDVMRHMMEGKNVGLIATRQTRDKWEILAASHIVGHKSLAAYDINTFFPLYLYPATEQKGLFDLDIPSITSVSRRPNLSPIFITDISNKLNMQFIYDGKGDLRQKFGPEDIFSYMYAVFHSPTFRERYAEFLKIDFPRLPLTSSSDLFRALCKLGEQLVGLHLMEKFGKITPKYPMRGNNLVEKIEYQEPKDQSELERVHING